ncbi:MAG TPA: thiamine-phosphate kinase [Tepidisphaeraceae bacterium]|jgi:thiamine-monophosphate kinase
MPAEFDFISWVRGQQKASEMVQLPAGDDLAVVKWKPEDLLLVGTDQVLDGVHFDSKVHSPDLIGRKVMNRNLSDCAAMACLPLAAVATVALPRGTSLEYAKQLYLGMKQAGEAFGCEIVGGDTASWDGKLVVTISILGRSAGIKPVTRKGAKPEDGIYVTGPLGGSLVGRHMTFAPRVKEGIALGRAGVHAMIDISDGLSRDLKHICEESGVGAVVEARCVPIHEDARKIQDGRAPLEHALHDGEDHELLFTDSRAHPDWIRIGEITADTGIFLEQDGKRTPLDPKGWEHRF